MSGVSAFEVRCPSCDVSFPPSTRRCMHCGGRTGPGRAGGSEGPSVVYVEPAEYQEAYSQIDATESSPLPQEEEPRAKGRGRMNAGISVVWILMAVAFSVMRACGGGG